MDTQSWASPPDPHMEICRQNSPTAFAGDVWRLIVTASAVRMVSVIAPVPYVVPARHVSGYAVASTGRETPREWRVWSPRVCHIVSHFGEENLRIGEEKSRNLLLGRSYRRAMVEAPGVSTTIS